jgi:two-component system, chemotaxis family, CheB/CheR fusion protein
LWTLIIDLLDTTRISEGQLMLKPERIDISTLIEECRVNFEGTSRTHHKIITNVKENLFVDADRERILQVLTNLVSNAIKYSPNGGSIFISANSKDSNVVISIEDQGIGIPEESQKLIFQRFYRSSNPVIGTFPGIGLGLYITNEIVRRHGGTISVESKEGKGSKFTVTLPIHGFQDEDEMHSKKE